MESTDPVLLDSRQDSEEMIQLDNGTKNLKRAESNPESGNEEWIYGLCCFYGEK